MGLLMPTRLQDASSRLTIFRATSALCIRLYARYTCAKRWGHTLGDHGGRGAYAARTAEAAAQQHHDRGMHDGQLRVEVAHRGAGAFAELLEQLIVVWVVGVVPKVPVSTRSERHQTWHRAMMSCRNPFDGRKVWSSMQRGR